MCIPGYDVPGYRVFTLPTEDDKRTTKNRNKKTERDSRIARYCTGE